MKKILLLFVLSFFLNACVRHLEPIWQTKAVLKVPESVYFDAVRNRIYVSNINGNPAEKDRNGFLSLLKTNGNIIRLQWVTGLNAPKGMALKNDKLYVSDIDRVAEVNINTGKIIRFYPAKGALFLNDITVDKHGNIYISDSRKGVLYRLDSDGNMELWLNNELLEGANGLAMENGKLLVGANGHLLSVDAKNKKITTLINIKGTIDGLIPFGHNRYVVSDWSGKIQIIEKGKKPVVLSNTTAEKINAADLGFISKEKILLIPTFFDNRVIAKRIVK